MVVRVKQRHYGFTLQPRQRRMRTCGLVPRRSIDRSQALWPQRMQAVEFQMNFVLFIIAAAIFPKLDTIGVGAHGFELIDYFSSFWIQFGPNSTNFFYCRRGLSCPNTGYCACTVFCSGEVWSVDGHCLVLSYWLSHKSLGRLLFWTHRLLPDRGTHPRDYWS